MKCISRTQMTNLIISPHYNHILELSVFIITIHNNIIPDKEDNKWQQDEIKIFSWWKLNLCLVHTVEMFQFWSLFFGHCSLQLFWNGPKTPRKHK